MSKGKIVASYNGPKEDLVRFTLRLLGIDGGKGSGNWGHRGRPGKVGGSGKGSGGKAFRSGSKEEGYKSFARHKEFKGIMEAAREAKNISKFLDSLTEEQYSALEDQHAETGTEESLYEYQKRIFTMLNHDHPEKKMKGWYDALSEEDQDMVDQFLQKVDSFGQVFGQKWYSQKADQIVDNLGKKLGWSETILDRNFENLTDDERKDLNMILDSFPWGDGPKYSKIPNEEFIRNASYSTNQYYSALKAKALGVEDVVIPERPDGIKYLEKHGRLRDVFRAQDGGYVHTKAGDMARKSVKEKLQKSANCFKRINGIPYSNSDEEGPYLRNYREKIIASVDTMDDRMAQLVDRTLERAEIIWSPTTGTCNFDHQRINMFYGDSGHNGIPRSAEDVARTFWHEYGHFCDNWISKSGVKMIAEPLVSIADTKDGATAIAVYGDEYKKAAQEDIQGLLELAGMGDKYAAQYVEHGQHVGIRRREDGKWIDGVSDPDMFFISEAVDKALRNLIGYGEWENFMYDHGQPVEPKFTDYYKTYTTPKRKTVKTVPKKKGYDEKYHEAMIEYRQKFDAWEESIGEEKYAELLRQKQALYDEYQRKKEMLGGITDCIDDAVQGAFMLAALWGAHSIDYYEQKRWPIETAANIFSARVRNDSVEIDFMSKCIPNIASVMTKAWRCGDNE